MAKTPAVLTPEDVNAALAGAAAARRRPAECVGASPHSGEFQQLQNILIGWLRAARSGAERRETIDRSTTRAGGRSNLRLANGQERRHRSRTPCLVHDGERRHFASARFDRYLRPVALGAGVTSTR